MSPRLLTAATVAGFVACGWAGAQAATSPATPAPVYVHMNGANDFLERVVAVRPGQAVVFVNEDTGGHTIVGYEPYKGGATIKNFDGTVAGTPGPGHKVSTWRISFPHTGVYAYYCSVHARLEKTYNHGHDHYVAAVPTQAVLGPPVDGYGGPMDGLIIVTDDPRILAATPATAHERILPDFFGG